MIVVHDVLPCLLRYCEASEVVSVAAAQVRWPSRDTPDTNFVIMVNHPSPNLLNYPSLFDWTTFFGGDSLVPPTEAICFNNNHAKNPLTTSKMQEEVKFFVLPSHLPPNLISANCSTKFLVNERKNILKKFFSEWEACH